jgi:hypothetical protein
MLKEFEELLLDNTLFKVQNQALGDKNPKWKEWWQTVQMFIEVHILENMELAHSEEQSYQLELQAYCIVFPNFKYELPSFVYEEIGTSSKVRITRFVVQLVAITKLVSPLRGGTCLDIISLAIQTFTIHVQVATITNEPMRGSEKYVKEHIEPVDLSFTILDSGVGPLEFLSLLTSRKPPSFDQKFSTT